MVDYLRKQDVIVYEGQDDLARNEAFEHLARHIGTHFDLVGPFYEKMKRAVASGHGQRIDIDRWSEHERSAAVQLGTMLHRHGLLKDFYYHRSPKKQLRVIPTKDGATAQFLTGGWLEIYVSWLLTRRLKSRMSPSKFQVLFNVKGTLPDLKEFEADLMANVDGRMLWVECKTGNWQDYSARFKGLVKIFGCDRESAGLLLIRPPDSSTRSRITDMLDMTLISLEEVDGFMNRFLGISDQEAALYRSRERERDPNDRTAPLPLGVLPPLGEEEIPLEDAAPARRLGHLALDADSPADASTGRRRRRGRRGGRGRRRAGEGDSAGKLNEPLPIEPVDAEPAPDSPEPAPGPAEEKVAGEERSSRRRRRRRSSPFAEGEKGGESAPAEGAAEDAEVQDEPTRPSAAETLAGLAAAVEADAAESAESADGSGSGEDAAEPDAGSKEAEEASKPRRRRRRRRRKSEEEASPPAVAETNGEAVPADRASADAEPDPSEGPAADSAAAVETPEAKPRRRRRKTKAESLAEASAELAGVEESGAAPVEAEVVAEPIAAAPPPELAEVVPEEEPEPDPVPDPAPVPEPVSGSKKSASGVTISPELAAMFAQPAKRKDEA
ncbi:MAG: hypothetical protein H8E31_06890 [Planctomycetes bacterium]|nr:hypothetical protein [Planctomycetota bacterium]